MKPILNPSEMLIRHDKDILELQGMVRILKLQVRNLEEIESLRAAGTSALELEGMK